MVVTSKSGGGSNPAGGIIMLATAIVAIWISLAIQVKRWHDLDQSGWWVLIGFIPYVNFIVLIILGFIKGTEGINRFGRDPLGVVYRNASVPENNAGYKDDQIEKAMPTENNIHSNAITLLGIGHNVPSIILKVDKDITVGRSSFADVSIDNSYISGQHLRFSLDPNGNVQVRDLGSSNGTYLEGRKLEPNIAYELKSGQRLIVASEDVVYTL